MVVSAKIRWPVFSVSPYSRSSQCLFRCLSRLLCLVVRASWARARMQQLRIEGCSLGESSPEMLAASLEEELPLLMFVFS